MSWEYVTHEIPLVGVGVSWATAGTIDSWWADDCSLDISSCSKDDLIDVSVPGLVWKTSHFRHILPIIVDFGR